MQRELVTWDTPIPIPTPASGPAGDRSYVCGLCFQPQRTYKWARWHLNREHPRGKDGQVLSRPGPREGGASPARTFGRPRAPLTPQEIAESNAMWAAHEARVAEFIEERRRSDEAWAKKKAALDAEDAAKRKLTRNPLPYWGRNH